MNQKKNESEFIYGNQLIELNFVFVGMSIPNKKFEATSTVEGHRPDISKTNLSKICSKCGKLDSTFKCSKCKNVYYCSKECQISHWAQHKIFCSK